MSCIASLTTFSINDSLRRASAPKRIFVYKRHSKNYQSYNLSAFSKSKEEILAAFWNIGVSVNALSFFLVVRGVVFPVNTALNFAFKVGWVFTWGKSHFNVEVSVGLELPGHRFEFQVIATII
jgi:hypothetical protein